ncbi:hypothetical protein L6R50_00790 [Myxococcota bacterium]|nr:hypothetical protein [Myxococcota bacterium]
MVDVRAGWAWVLVAGLLAGAAVGSPGCGEDDPCIAADPESLTDDPAFFDADGDGSRPCSEPSDCDDADPRISPHRAEVCDGLDNDCNGAADEGFDTDGDGVRSCDGDCANADPAVHPGAVEACDGVDTDCDPGTVVEGDEDRDRDGFLACGDAPDCDDSEPAVNPGVEVDGCDGVDEDCDGELDEDAQYFLWWPDADGDGKGDPAGSPVEACSADFLPGDVARVSNDDDCDDADGANFPGNPEVCDGQDNDCSGAPEEDEVDGDGDGASPCAGDCDDAEPAAHPGGEEACDGIDRDCDGLPGDHDADGDGQAPCHGDCDDSDPAVYPGATDVDGDGVDSDCDGADG